jgi:hypothetical protein
MGDEVGGRRGEADGALYSAATQRDFRAFYRVRPVLTLGFTLWVEDDAEANMGFPDGRGETAKVQTWRWGNAAIR